jgi:hypothetical protein
MGGTTKGEHPNYRCQNHGCQTHATVPQPILDQIVTERLISEIHRAVSDYRARGEIVRGKVLDRLARYWTLRTGGKATAEIVAARDDVTARLARLREMKLEGDFDHDPTQYRRLHDDLTAQAEKLSGEIDAQLPTPDEVLADDFAETMDFETRRDVIRLLLDVRVTKAPRPGVKFIPKERVKIKTAAVGGLTWGEVFEIARHAEKAYPEKIEAALESAS